MLDEADRLLSEGHFKELEQILDALDREIDDGEEARIETKEIEPLKPSRQTLVFSATFQKDLQQKLSGKGKRTKMNIMSKEESMEYLLQKLNFRKQPQFIDVNPISQMATGLKEGIIECAGLEKVSRSFQSTS